MPVIQPQPIRTHRLTLLPLAVAHAEEMAGVLADPELYAFIGGTPPTPQALRERYERLAAGSPDPGVSWCNWVVRLGDADADCLTGTVQATVTDGGETAEIAWMVGTPWQRRGIATEAVRQLVAWLAARGVGTVVAHIHPDHAASAAVATAAGLKPTDEWNDGEIRWRLDTTPGRNPTRCP
ncbi:GNAT family N-acetyltransferase [Streptomyces vilmorinianum]|uniref:GNAT family N-acetyltransferase n=1 Tax=Streptomyces vilmorinianum TaxID=3051092 RepID=UPI0010FB7C22|nr:GNAT family N-acetyltransferase [Streptomyces vilmorinianum]